MLFSKTRIIGLALAGVMTIGSTTAFAAGKTSLTPGGTTLAAESTTLTAVANVNIADIVARKGTATVVKGATLHLANGQTGKTEAFRTLTLTAANVNLADIVAQKGTATIVKGVTPSIIGGQTAKTTAAK